MNLENLNLVELNTEEVQETEGGFLGILITVYLALAYYDHQIGHGN